MSDMVEKAIDKLPDVWFDWYARLLPGCFGVALHDYLSSSDPGTPKAREVVLLLLFGYGLGHILQPLTGFVIKRIEKRFGNESKYAKGKKDADIKPSSLGKISKAHAEANSMLSFGFALLLNMIVSWNSTRLNKWYACIALIYFGLAAVERTWARNRKIDDLYPQ